MNNLIEINKTLNEVTVYKNGEAYISQRKAAEILGVSRDSLKSYIERNLHPVNSELNQGLNSETFAICTQYYALDARNTTSQAKALLKQISTAGAKAYLYHMAGYEFKVEQKQDVKPMSQLQILAQVAQSLADQEQQLLLVEQQQREQGEVLENVCVSVEQIKEDLIPKVQDYELLTSASGAMTINSFAKVLVGSGIDYPDRKLRKWLKDKGYTYSEASNENQPKSTYVKSGHFKVVNTQGANRLWYATTMITPKGQQTVARRIRKEEGTWTR